MIDHLVFIIGTTAIAFVLYQVADEILERRQEVGPFERWLHYSVTFGLLAAISIGFGHEMRPGVIIDARGAVLAVATIVAGYRVGAATAGIALLVRLALGGAGMKAGLAGIVLDFGVSALLVSVLRKRGRDWTGQLILLSVCGAAVGCVEGASLGWVGSVITGDALFRAAGRELFITQLTCTLLLGSLVHLQRERRQSREIFQTALATSMDGFLLLGVDGRVRETNTALETMTGYSRTELLDMNLAQLQVGKSPAEVTARLTEVRARGHLLFESKWRRKDGREMNVAVAAIAAPESVGGVYAFNRDITEQKQAERALRESEARYRLLADVSSDVIWLYDLTANRFAYVSPSAERLRGFTAAEVMQQTVSEVMSTESYQNVERLFTDRLKAFTAGKESARTQTYELTQKRRDGTIVQTEVVTTLVTDEEGRVTHVQGVSRDISEHKRAEAELRRLNRALRATRECGKVLVHATEEQDLLDQVCQILVEQGGYRMAWVGYPEQDEEKTVRPVAEAGFEDGYLAAAKITWADNERGRGPTGISLRAREPAVIRDIASDPRMAQWRQRALQHGYAASAALPLLHRDDLLGALTVYADTPNAFDDSELMLLTELTNDLAYGVVALRERSARAEAERALRESQRSLATLMGNLPGMAYRCRNDSHWTLEFVSEGCRALLGYASADLIRNTALCFGEFVHPDDREAVRSQVQAALAQGQRFQVTYRVHTASGSVKWVSEQGMGILAPSGGLLALEGFIYDITAQKEGEESLSKFRLLSEYAKDIILFVRPGDGRIVEANRAAIEAYGYDRNELLERSLYDLRLGDQAAVAQQIARAAQAGILFEACHRRRDGSTFPVEISARAAQVGGETLLLSVVRDLTARNLMEDELRQANERLASILNSVPVIVCAFRLNQESIFNIDYISPNCAQVTGCSAQEFMASSKLWGDHIHPEDREEALMEMRQLGKHGHFAVEYRWRMPDGSYRWFYERALRVAATDDGMTRGVSVWMDITERVGAETALRDLNLQLEQRVKERTAEALDLYHKAPCGYHSLDKNARILEMNDTELEWLGYGRAEVVGHLRLSDLMPATEAQRFETAYAQFVESGTARSEEWELRRKDGSALTVFVKAVAQRDSAGHFMQRRSTVLDITDRKAAEARLDRQLRLQQVLMEISSTYINLPLEAFETTLQTSLGDLGRFVAADRVYVFDYAPGMQMASNTHEWCAEGIEPQMANMQGVPMTVAPDWVTAHRQGQTIMIPDVLALPDGELRRLLLSQDVKSLLTIPLMNQGECVGFVGFDSVSQHHVYTQEEQQLLQLFGHMLVNVRRRKQTQQSLMEERQRLAGILQSTNVGTWEWNIQTGEVILNERWAAMKGYTLAELAPITIETVRRFVHPEDLEVNRTVLERHLRGELEYYELETQMRHKNGSWIWVREHGRVMTWTADGKPLLMQGTQQDVTARKQLEATLQESEEKFRNLFENSRDAIILTDLAGKTLDCNRAAVAMFQLADKPELLARGLLALSPARQPDGRDSREAFGEVVELASAKGTHFCEWQHRRVDGTEFPAEISISTIEIQGKRVLHGLVHDVSLRKTIERELRASEAKFRRLVEMAPLPMALMDPEGNIQLLNARFTQTFGYTNADLPTIETWWVKAFPDPSYRSQTRIQWEAVVAQAVQGAGGVPPSEYHVTCKDGTARTILISGTAMADQFLAGFLDITTLKQATEKLRKLSQAVEFSPSMILITDDQGRVDYANPAWEQVTGYRLEEVVGRRPRLLKSGVHTPEFYANLWTAITAGQIWRGEFCNRRKNGELYWEAAAIAPVRNEAGIITHYIAVKEDITARRAAEEELRLAKEAADAANRAKSAFLANMSHEIRTPMNAILGFSQLLLRESELSAEQRLQLTTIIRSGEHLMGIINGILEMARIESGRVTLNPVTFDLHQMLGDLERMFSLRAQGKDLRFRVVRQGEVPCQVTADETKLRQVFINLLSNAAKFTSSGGEITLRVGSTAEPDGMVRLHAEVQDTGVGISQEEVARLFEPFFQASSGKQVSGGTGLGLAITREFVQLMGGSITVSTQLGSGSTFRFDVRLTPATAPPSVSETPPVRRILHLRPGSPVCRVLVADDAEENRELLQHLLAPLGFEVRIVADGAEAVAQSQAWLPHVVLLDLRMPVMDGYEAARQIRVAQGTAVKIIALTASVFSQDQQQAIAAGADAFLGKPFRATELLERVQQLTGVDFIYGEPQEAPAAIPVTPDSRLPNDAEIRQLPAALLEALREATCKADYFQMLTLVDEIATQNEPVGRQLRDLVKNFDYGTLQRLLSGEERRE